MWFGDFFSWVLKSFSGVGRCSFFPRSLSFPYPTIFFSKKACFPLFIRTGLHATNFKFYSGTFWSMVSLYGSIKFLSCVSGGIQLFIGNVTFIWWSVEKSQNKLRFYFLLLERDRPRYLLKQHFSDVWELIHKVAFASDDPTLTLYFN